MSPLDLSAVDAALKADYAPIMALAAEERRRWIDPYVWDTGRMRRGWPKMHLPGHQIDAVLAQVRWHRRNLSYMVAEWREWWEDRRG